MYPPQFSSNTNSVNYSKFKIKKKKFTINGEKLTFKKRLTLRLVHNPRKN